MCVGAGVSMRVGVAGDGVDTCVKERDCVLMCVCACVCACVGEQSLKEEFKEKKDKRCTVM